MRILFFLPFFASITAFASNTNSCINLEDAKTTASGQNYVELEEYPLNVTSDLIDTLVFDESIKEYSSDVYVSSSWPGGYEGVQMFVSCDGKVSFWKGCSGDCD